VHTDNDEKPRPDDTTPEPPAEDGPPEVADAARQEAEYPEDETDEG
jgi:hypothetical protein